MSTRTPTVFGWKGGAGVGEALPPLSHAGAAKTLKNSVPFLVLLVALRRRSQACVMLGFRV